MTRTDSLKRVLVVPAAGRGTRLRSTLPKLLTPVAGRAMIDLVMAKYETVCDVAVVVVSPEARPLVDSHAFSPSMRVGLAEQTAPTGMLDAILAARETVVAHDPDRVWITWCDQVAVAPTTVDRLVALEAGTPEAAAFVPVVRQSPPYIHFDQDPAGRLSGVRHRREGDEMPEVGTSDAGLFALSAEAFTNWLPRYADHASLGAKTGERNFLPFLPWLAARASVELLEVAPIEAQGINSPEDLALIEGWLMAQEGRS